MHRRRRRLGWVCAALRCACASYVFLEVRARFPWVRFAAQRAVAMRGKANRCRAVRVRCARDLVRQRALAAVRPRCLDQRVTRGFNLVLRMARYPRLRALPPNITLGLVRTRQRRCRDLHDVRVHLPLR